jgi:hypothetical protein
MEEPFEKSQIVRTHFAPVVSAASVINPFPGKLSYGLQGENPLPSLHPLELSLKKVFQRNPMRSERITALGRKLARLPANFTATFETQWFERT